MERIVGAFAESATSSRSLGGGVLTQCSGNFEHWERRQAGQNGPSFVVKDCEGLVLTCESSRYTTPSASGNKTTYTPIFRKYRTKRLGSERSVLRVCVLD